MADNPGLTQFKEGLQLLQKGYASEAYEHLHGAVELEPQNPYYQSFLGLCVARARRKWDAAALLCETALNSKRNDAQLFLNLAEVYKAAGRRDEAIAVLDRGLIYFRTDTRMKRARADLGRRVSPIVPFLEREHFLNRNLGKFRHRVLGRLQKPQNENRKSSM